MTAAASFDEAGSTGTCSSVLKVEAVSRSFGARRALGGIDLALGRGEIYALLGPNGAGKTSLVRAVSGRLRLDGGSVRVCGQDPSHDRGARRHVGLVPQEIALYGELSGRENLEVFGRLMGIAGQDLRGRVGELLERVDLADRADDRVETLSGGMKRRLNLAAGVIHSPQLLLLDEPTVGVDPSARERIHELLLELRRDGLAILLTTHDLDQATVLADRVGLLIDGRLRAEGPVDELVHRVFGDAKEVIVRLRRGPVEKERVVLEEVGFEPATDPRIWTARVAASGTDFAHRGRELEEAGLEIEELRVREPSLRGVYFQLAGREIDA